MPGPINSSPIEIKENFNKLPTELQNNIASHLDSLSLYSWYLSDKAYYGIFFYQLNCRKTSIFLQHVVRGQYDKVQTMLKYDMELLVKRAQVTDYSGRFFCNISGFEYALWALDKNLWTLMLACIPQTAEGLALLIQLLIQYVKFKEKKVTYKLGEKIINEKHFDFENTIIKALQTQINLINAPIDTRTWEGIDKQWCEEVGRAQRLLPMHVVYEYCSDVAFFPLPSFTNPPKSSQQFRNVTTNKMENWFCFGSKLGTDFAIIKFRWPYAGGEKRSRGWCPTRADEWPVADLNAMTALCNLRRQDFITLQTVLVSLVVALRNNLQVTLKQA